MDNDQIDAVALLRMIWDGKQSFRHVQYSELGKLQLPPCEVKELPTGNVVPPDTWGGAREMVGWLWAVWHGIMRGTPQIYPST